MPTIGDEIHGKDIGRSGSSARGIFVWVHCPVCTEERWTQKKSSYNPVNNATRRCSKCAIKLAKQFRINPEKAALEGRI
ncbi:hypothetical protein CMI37_12855 [Candidatus Pacearchaeota archaeon]|jgi:hypothetical protein|nr:hypothetical protein [Candidatus Pacearchaeota archaeon]|tara:strand:- start:6061 stop:6297 length:237 start_codon:yes stop_codon:yes gene_type:complete